MSISSNTCDGQTVASTSEALQILCELNDLQLKKENLQQRIALSIHNALEQVTETTIILPQQIRCNNQLLLEVDPGVFVALLKERTFLLEQYAQLKEEHAQLLAVYHSEKKEREKEKRFQFWERSRKQTKTVVKSASKLIPRKKNSSGNPQEVDESAAVLQYESVAAAPDYFGPLCRMALPRWPLVPYPSSSFLCMLKGPSHSSTDLSDYLKEKSNKDIAPASFEECVFARSISTYPYSTQRGMRLGDPICDSFCISLHTARCIIAVADGCNWGERPRRAAQRAAQAFATFVEKSMDVSTIQDIGHILLEGVAAAQEAITADYADAWEAGNATLLGGIALQLKTNASTKWCFYCANVGDCKVFHAASSTGRVEDITAGNRNNVDDPTDPGGRLGPYCGTYGDPDLRNLCLYFRFVEEGDFIIVVSDGVHDNLDPELCGRSPSSLGLDFVSWEAASNANETQVELVKKRYMEEKLQELIFGMSEFRPCQKSFSQSTLMGSQACWHLSLRSGESGDGDRPAANCCPRDVVYRLIDHCVSLTRNARDLMEADASAKQPYDYVKYPGKMDHTTCVCYRIGPVSSHREIASKPYRDSSSASSSFWRKSNVSISEASAPILGSDRFK